MTIEQISLRAHNGVTAVVFGVDPSTVETAGYEGPDVSIEILLGDLEARAVIPTYAFDLEGIAEFFREIDRDWRGWAGEKKFEGPGRWFAMDAEHDGKGHVDLKVTLSNGWPMKRLWTVEATVPMDVGSIDGLAGQFEDWVGRFVPHGNSAGTPRNG